MAQKKSTRDETILKLAKSIECPICRDVFDDPRSLPCLHSYCKKCIKKHAENKLPGDEAECPVCREKFTVPAGGVDNLKKDFFRQELVEIQSLVAPPERNFCQICSDETPATAATVYCVECNQCMCDQCGKYHQKMKVSQKHEIISMGEDLDLNARLKRKASYCPNHPEEIVRYFCEDCDRAICVTCALIDKHTSHSCADIGQVAVRFGNVLREDIRAVSDHVVRTQGLADSLSFGRQKFLNSVSETEKAIKKSAEELKQAVDRQADALLYELADFKASKMKESEEIGDEIERNVVTMQSFVYYSQELLDRGCSYDVVQYYKEGRTRSDKLQAVKMERLPVFLKSMQVNYELPDMLRSEINLLGRLVTAVDSVKEQRVVFSFRSSSGIDVRICRGNITDQKVEAIVNAANVRLSHGSGVARCIKDAAGMKFNDECKELVKRCGGRLNSFEAVHTSAGDIPPPVKYVIHVAGPEARDFHDKRLLEDAMRKTFENVLMYANDVLKVSSVAIPAISSGIYGVPKQVVAECTFEALQNFELKHLSSRKKYLQIVSFVNIDEETTRIIEKVFRKYCSDTTLAAPPKPDPLEGREFYTMGDSGSLFSGFWSGRGIARGAGSNSALERQQAGGKDNDRGAGGRPEADDVTTKNDDNTPHPADVKPPDAAPLVGRVRRFKMDDCVICMDRMVLPKKLDCGHSFCKECIDQYFKNVQPKCPNCGKIFGVLKGNQPPGTRNWTVKPISLAGYPGCRAIEITYNIPDGIQTDEHPNPGQPFQGARRTGYLPDNPEGHEVRKLLERAFNARLIFTVGRSVTSGKDDVVVWNDVHHKTKPSGPHGYPDNTYLKRVTEELAAKGIVP